MIAAFILKNRRNDNIYMDNMGRDRGADTDPRGTMNRFGNGWRINNALVEEVSAGAGQTGYLIVSYAVRGRDQDLYRDRGQGQGRDRYDMTRIELLRLNVNRNTIITNRNGRNINLRRIRPGMYIDAEFSYAMTRSIPPQATAFRIRVTSRLQEPEPRPRVTTAPVVSVDVRNGFLLTGDRRDPNRQIRFVVTDQTQILDRRGRNISLRALSPGQLVQVTHADFMTMSIPPQTNAFRIQVL